MQRRQLLHTLGLGLGASVLPHAAQAQPAQLPCFILCVPGGRGWLTRLNTQVRAFGHGFRVDTEYSADEADSRMTRAFQASAHRAEPSYGKADQQAIASHQTVGYVLSPQLTTSNALTLATQALALGAQLLQAGALGLKSESAGLVHGKARWLDLAARSAQAGPAQSPAAKALLYQAWVQRPIGGADMRYSCGMHQLGLPDLEDPLGGSDRESLARIDQAAQALLSDQRVAGKRVPNQRQEADSPYANPWGYVRLGA